MKVHGLTLPDSFIESLNNNIFYRKVGSWPLKKEIDSFGNPLETEIGHVFASVKEITNETNNLSRNYIADGIYGTESEWKQKPGFTADITNFSKIVSFAIAADGSPFCFDFRGSEDMPEIIWWEDCYWRVISPNFEEFIKLFELNSYQLAQH